MCSGHLAIYTTLFAVVSSETLHSYPGTTPTLDGILTPAEWADAYSFGGISTFHPGFFPVLSPADLDILGFVKHDSKRLYFGFNITDDLLYSIDTPSWLPPGNPSAENLTRQGWPWYGDEMELLINAPNTFTTIYDEPTGTPGVWQMVCNAHKSRLGGLGVGGLLEGEPRSSDTAWANYQEWIYSRAMECGVHIFHGAGINGSSVFGVEWAVDFNPLLEISPGVYYNGTGGVVEMGVNIALGDTDTPAEGDPVFGLRHEMWFSGNTSCENHGNCHTLLSRFGSLFLHSSRN